MRKLIVGTVETLQQARALVTALERHAFGTDEITIVFPEDERASSVAIALDRNEDLGRGAFGGAIAGAIFGAIVGAALLLRGGLLVDVGPAFALVATIVVGTLWGSILGMALGRVGRPRRDATNHRAIVVTVEVDGEDRLAESRALFEKWGAHDVSARAA